MSAHDDLLGLVERVARRLPDVPRITILEAVELEWERLRAASEPHLRPLVAPSALQRLRDPSAA
ncbi:hypothetical protein [Amnibacterium endophyticum]|uniref:Uncharacterized protein n=1 Tax=Amnibacterium endophyticum TaxID=2109337 RepID=A0ABW4LHK6_9MICO